MSDAPRILVVLRDARWLTRDRVRAYALAYAALALAALVGMGMQLSGRHGGPPMSIDYLSFHAAARLALAGQAPAAWDPELHAAMEAALQGAPGGRYYAFFYPPIFLLICLPFGWLPLVPAFLAWVGATAAACLLALRGWTAGRDWLTAAILGLGPAGLLNAMHGQNAFLTTALLAWAGGTLDRAPALAGAALATLSFKPQLGLLIVPALLAARRWRALAWATVVGLLWAGAGWGAFGSAAWRAFLARLPDAGAALASGALDTWKVQSVYALARSAGIAQDAATLAQAALSITVAALVTLAARRARDGRAVVALVAAGAPLVTPFVLVYDLLLLSIPSAWLIGRSRVGRPLPWERTALVLAWVWPLMAFVVGFATRVSPGPFAALVVLLLVLRRQRGEAVAAPAGQSVARAEA